MAGLLSDEELIDKLYGPDADTVDADVYRRFGLTPNLKRGTVLPVARDEQGNLTPAVPQAVIDFLKAVSLPGHVMRGGQYAPSDVTEMALNTGLLGSVATKPTGALASGLARNAAELPMDEASRMARAREMGFDWNQPSLHHGTDAEFDAFKLGLRGASAAVGRPSLGSVGVYLTPDKYYAQAFGGNIKSDLLVKGPTKTVDLSPGFSTWAKENNFENPQDMVNKYYDGFLDVALDLDDALVNAARAARAEGFNAVRVHSGALTDGGPHKRPIDVTIVFDPKDIRSRFAAFDPAKKESADLLAGVAGLPGVASFLEGVNKDSRKRGISKVTK